MSLIYFLLGLSLLVEAPLHRERRTICCVAGRRRHDPHPPAVAHSVASLFFLEGAPYRSGRLCDVRLCRLLSRAMIEREEVVDGQGRACCRQQEGVPYERRPDIGGRSLSMCWGNRAVLFATSTTVNRPGRTLGVGCAPWGYRGRAAISCCASPPPPPPAERSRWTRREVNERGVELEQHSGFGYTRASAFMEAANKCLVFWRAVTGNESGLGEGCV